MDSRTSSLRELAPGHWLLNAGPHLQTWRFPQNLGLPDMAASVGVLGYYAEKQSIYVHTDGRPTVELKLRPATTAPDLAHLRISHSSGDITVSQLTQNTAVLHNASALPVRIAIAGTAASAQCSILISGHGNTETQSLPANAQGEISFILMEGKEARITTTRSVAIE